jgi:signal peptidase I
MSITERLANLSTLTVIITVLVLLGIRFLLRKQQAPVAKSIAETAESLAIAMALVFLIIRPFIVQAFFIPSESMNPGLLKDDHILVNRFLYRFRELGRGDVVVFKAPIDATPDVQREILDDADARGLDGPERDSYITNESKRREKDFIKRVIAVPGDMVRITPGYVMVGAMHYGHRDLESILRGFAREGGFGKVKLINGEVLVDGRLVSKAEVAAAAGEPSAKVKVVTGVVYVNGKALKEPYTAEDPDSIYPLENTNPDWIVTRGKVRFVKIPKGKLLVMGDNRNDSNDSRFWPSGLPDKSRVMGKAMFIFWPVSRIRWVH